MLRERERERERGQTGRQTDRQIQSQTDRDKDRERQRERQTDRQRCREIYKTLINLCPGVWSPHSLHKLSQHVVMDTSRQGTLLQSIQG